MEFYHLFAVVTCATFYMLFLSPNRNRVVGPVSFLFKALKTVVWIGFFQASCGTAKAELEYGMTIYGCVFGVATGYGLGESCTDYWKLNSIDLQRLGFRPMPDGKKSMFKLVPPDMKMCKRWGYIDESGKVNMDLINVPDRNLYQVDDSDESDVKEEPGRRIGGAAVVGVAENRSRSAAKTRADTR